MKKDLPLPEGPSTNLLRLVVIPRFMGRSGDVKVQRFSREPVHHLDAEGRERAAVVGFLCEQAHRLFDEGVETLFRREVRRIAGYRRPVECRAVDGVVARHAFHACQLAAHVVLDMLQFLRIVAPRHDVEVCPYRGQSVRWASFRYWSMSSRSAPLRELSPLRTVRESFPSYGSSNSKLLFVTKSRLIVTSIYFC